MMFKSRHVQIYVILLVFIVFIGIGYSSELEQFSSGFHLGAEYQFEMEKSDLSDSGLQTLSGQLISEDYALDDRAELKRLLGVTTCIHDQQADSYLFNEQRMCQGVKLTLEDGRELEIWKHF